MPTENPKISAYVPQVVYDRVKQFQEENNISSMSQAAIEIFAQYFGIDLNAGTEQQFTSGLPSRLENLETELAGLKDAYTLLVKRVDLIESTGRLLPDSVKIPVFEALESELPSSSEHESPFKAHEGIPDSTFLSEPVSSLESVSPVDSSASFVVNESIPTESSSELSSESPKQLDLISSNDVNEDLHDSLLSRLKINPLESKQLAVRINSTEATVNNTKSKSTEEEFRSWVVSKDPDGIEWVSLIADGKRSKGYVPSDRTSLDKLQKLSDWLNENTK